MTKKLNLLLTLQAIILISCNYQEPKKESTTTTEKNTLNIREIAGTMNLHPLYIMDELSGVVSTYIFQTLTSIDFKTLELSPLLAKSLPKVNQLDNGLVSYEFEIREEAMWDDNRPIDAADVDFSIKVNLLPDPNNTGNNEFLESIADFKYDSLNPKKFTITTSMDIARANYLVGDIIILPKSIYDSTNTLKTYDIHSLIDNRESNLTDTVLLRFVAHLNDSKFKSNPSYIKGSGPYQVKEIMDGQSLTLEKKKSWWGDSIQSNNTEFEVYVDIIKFHIIPDETTAISALKSGSIDLMRGVSPKEFSEMKTSQIYSKRLNFVTSPILAYYCLGLNLNNPILKMPKNRKALAYLLDVDKIIDIVAYGFGEQIIGPNALSDKKNYNTDLIPYKYNYKKAVKLLEEVGWKDSNEDGILDMEIEGINVPFELAYNYNSGNETRKRIGLIFQEEAKKAGIKINILPLEWSNYIDQLKSKNFDIAFVGKMFSPIPRNHKSTLHSESITEGSNYANYSNPEVDRLIDLINNVNSEEDRKKYNYRLQEIVHEELPYLFLYAPLERMVVNKKYSNYNLSAMRPGFWAPGFKLQK